MFFTQKLLVLAMKMGKSPYRIVRLLGKLLGIFPVWYSERMERKLFDGTWDPAKKYRKRMQELEKYD